METIFYYQYQAQLDIALMYNQITEEEYYEESIRETVVELMVLGLSSGIVKLTYVKK